MTTILKKLRVLIAAAKLQLPKKDWDELSLKYELMAYSDLDQASDSKEAFAKAKVTNFTSPTILESGDKHASI